MSSPLMFVRDGRNLAWFPVTQDALDAIADAAADDVPRRLPAARSLYLAILELANRQRGDRVAASRKVLGQRAGISRDLVSDLRELLERAQVLEVIERRHGDQQLEHEWRLIDPPLAGSQEGGGWQPRGVVAGSHTTAVEEDQESTPSTSKPHGSDQIPGAEAYRDRADTASPESGVGGAAGDAPANGNTGSSAAAENALAKYADPESPGAVAAPWMVLELARLMRHNDDKAKIPAAAARVIERIDPIGTLTAEGARDLMAEYSFAGAAEWLDAARLLVDRDERPPAEVARVLRFSQRDEFWRSNILSMPTFRKQYPKLRPKAIVAAAAAQQAGGTNAAQMDALQKGGPLAPKSHRQDQED